LGVVIIALIAVREQRASDLDGAQLRNNSSSRQRRAAVDCDSSEAKLSLESPSEMAVRVAVERRASEITALEAREAAATAGLRAVDAARRAQRACLDAEIDSASRGLAAAKRARATKRSSLSTVEQVAAALESDERALSDAAELSEAIRLAEARALSSVEKLRNLRERTGARHN
jgi:hypothetical protein